MLTNRLEVYFGGRNWSYPCPLLKAVLAGSQAISPAAAITGSPAATALYGVPGWPRFPPTSPGRNNSNARTTMITSKRL